MPGRRSGTDAGAQARPRRVHSSRAGAALTNGRRGQARPGRPHGRAVRALTRRSVFSRGCRLLPAGTAGAQRLETSTVRTYSC